MLASNYNHVAIEESRKSHNYHGHEQGSQLNVFGGSTGFGML